MQLGFTSAIVGDLSLGEVFQLAADCENFGLNYDPSHLVWLQIDYVTPIAEFSNRFFHVHAKDVRIDRQRLNQVGIMGHPNDYHSPKLPGLGDVHWGLFSGR